MRTSLFFEAFFLALACSLQSSYAQAPGECTSETQWESLVAFYDATGGDYWRSRDQWNTTAFEKTGCSRRSLGVDGNLVELPKYCCWFGVECCTDEICPIDSQFYGNVQCNCTPGTVVQVNMNWNNLSGSIPLDPMVSLQCSGNFRTINLYRNRITGSVPSELAQLDNLWDFQFGFNRLTGTIPPEFSEIYSLQILDLSFNSLTGTIPPSLCNFNLSQSELKILYLRDNQLTGGYSVSGCNSLLTVDVTNNLLDSDLTSNPGSNTIHWYRFGNNSIRGGLPGSSIDYTSASGVNLGKNSFAGSIPDDMSQFVLLTSLNLAGNDLTNTIPRDMFRQLGNLVSIDLSYNLLNGTISPQIGGLSSLAYVNFYSNSLYGTIPESMGNLDMIGDSFVDLRFNWLFCCGGEYTGNLWNGSYQYVNLTDEPLLPSFLVFSPLEYYTSPPFYSEANDIYNLEQIFKVQANMRCPRVVTRGSDLTSADNVTEYFIDPEYYGYKTCFCIPGYKLIPLEIESYGNVPIFGCVVVTHPWYVDHPWALALIIVIPTLLFLSWFVYYACFRQDSRLRLVQLYFDMKKRTQGEPMGGNVTVAVTYIEDYTRLCIEHPDDMMKALAIHSSVVEKAIWANFATTIEQEHGGYSLVFHEAIDAVVFCLQVQQALMRQDWPKDLMDEKEEHRSAKMRWSRRVVSRLGRRISKFKLVSKLFKSRSSASKDYSSPGIHEIRENSALTRELQSRVLSGSSKLMRRTGVSYSTNNSAKTDNTAAANTLRSWSNVSANTVEAFSYVDASVTSSEASIDSNKYDPYKDPKLFRGPRVRMGISTGDTRGAAQLKGCKVHQIAGIVSAASNGGQVMMDAPTFTAIKERIEELIAVDHNGLNHSRLTRKKARKFWQFWGSGRSDKLDDETPLLDMGTYVYSLLCTIPLMLGAPADRGSHNMISQQPASQSGDGHDDASSEREPGVHRISSASGMDSEGDSQPEKKEDMLRQDFSLTRDVHSLARNSRGVNINFDGEELHLYQILPSCLVQRAKAFGNKMDLAPEWVCIDQPYFSAPGTIEAPIGLVPSDITLDLPPITMIFCIIDGGKTYAAKFRRDARKVHEICASVIRNTLRMAPGGYLCRLQDGDLKYMVALPSSQLALAWCLMVQESLMYAEWPASSLMHWPEELCPDTNRLIFRGPRMKMGVCEGSPRSILPDHLGHADYHGASINQSARYMDAGAHGGQIVCEETTAMAALHVFQQEYDMLRGPRADRDRLGGASFRRTLPPHMDDTSANTNHPSSSQAPELYPVTEGRESNASAADAEGSGRDGVENSAVSTSSSLRRKWTDPSKPPPQKQVSFTGLGLSREQAETTAGKKSSFGLNSHPEISPQGGEGEGDSEEIAMGVSLPMAPGDYIRSMVGSDIRPAPDSPALPSLGDADPGAHNSAQGLLNLNSDSAAGTKPSSSHSAANLTDQDNNGERNSADVPTFSEGGGLLTQPPLMKPSLKPSLDKAPSKRHRSNSHYVKEVSEYMDSDNESEVDEANDPLPLRQKTYMTRASAHRTGIFQFKGNKEPINMVYVTTELLSKRKFPTDPPKGKGNRLSEASGLVMEAQVPLSDIVLQYREHWVNVHRQADFETLCNPHLIPTTAQGTPPGG